MISLLDETLSGHLCLAQLDDAIFSELNISLDIILCVPVSRIVDHS